MNELRRNPPSFGDALTDGDYQSLQSSWITKEMADTACLRRVDSVEGQQAVGQKRGNCAGILIPYYWPDEPTPRAYRIRRDSPETTMGSGGRLKLDRKYLSAPGERNRIYVPPGVNLKQLADTNLPLVITEGEKKTLALQRLALHDSTARFVPVGLAGVWNWRGVIGKEGGPNGERLDLKGPIPDLDRIEFSNRKVFIVFDSNVHSNPSVQKAREALAQELSKRGARVLYVDIPQDAGVNGVDDLLAAWGPDRVLRLFDQAIAPEEKKNRSQTEELLELVKGIQLFRTSEVIPFARVSDGETTRTLLVEGVEFKKWIRNVFYTALRKPVAKQSLQDAIDTLAAKAQFTGKVSELFVRIGHLDDRIYLDLADEKRFVEIRKDGWTLTQNVPLHFTRPRPQQALPVPAFGASIELLRPLVNIDSERDWQLLVFWLVGAFHPTGPYPILILQGGQGSAKSTLARFLRRIVDPIRPFLLAPPKDERDLLIRAQKSRVLAYDNLSGLSPALADAFCRLSTGGGLQTRQLFTDGDEFMFEATRPVILNGIDRLVARADLADRSIVLHLPTIPETARVQESELERKFEQALPGILGSILSGVSVALANRDAVELPRTPRLADFATWATASEPGLGFPEGSFLAAYRDNRSETVQLNLEEDLVGDALLLCVDSGDRFEGTCAELLEKLCSVVPEHQRRDREWPKSARALSGRLRRLGPFLRESGLQIEFNGRTNRRRILHIQRIDLDPTVTTVTTVTDFEPSAPAQPLADQVTGDGLTPAVTFNGQSDNRPSPGQSAQGDQSIGVCDEVTEVTVDHPPSDSGIEDPYNCYECGPVEDWDWDGDRKIWKCPSCGAQAPRQMDRA